MSGPVLAERTLLVAEEMETAALAEDLALTLSPGTALLLSGDLGAGKTALARALLRALHDDDGLEVPSPTFTLVQPYPGRRFPVAHVDLYRLQGLEAVDELGLSAFLETGALLVEWPERGGFSAGPGQPLVAIGFGAGETDRTIHLTGSAEFVARFDRVRAGRAFLDTANHAGGRRRFLEGDASTRRFERIHGPRAAATAILMDAPARPDGPPVRNGLSYSRLAGLAEDVRPFVAVGAFLRSAGLSAPLIVASDTDQGFLLCEDLGGEKIVVAGRPVPERYLAAADVLAHLHGMRIPDALPLPDGSRYRPGRFGRDVFGIELSLFTDWYLPAIGAELRDTERAVFEAIWDDLIARALADEEHLALRDFHSPNLMWLAGRKGIARVGIIDHQDALFGPTGYDLASLGQDARVTVPADLEAALLTRYATARRASGAPFDEPRFRETYAILAAQRAVRILGTFTRLDRRDGKPAYLAHIPRLRHYLARTLTHPSLANLRDWFARRPEASLTELANTPDRLAEIRTDGRDDSSAGR